MTIEADDGICCICEREAVATLPAGFKICGDPKCLEIGTRASTFSLMCDITSHRIEADEDPS